VQAKHFSAVVTWYYLMVPII